VRKSGDLELNSQDGLVNPSEKLTKKVKLHENSSGQTNSNLKIEGASINEPQANEVLPENELHLYVEIALQADKTRASISGTL
jgi:hypothetical protein